MERLAEKHAPGESAGDTGSEYDDTITMSSGTSWLDSMVTSKECSGLLDDPEEGESLLGHNQFNNTNYSTIRYVNRIQSYTDDNKWVKSLKSYNNVYAAIMLWTVGVVMLGFALF